MLARRARIHHAGAAVEHLIALIAGGIGVTRHAGGTIPALARGTRHPARRRRVLERRSTVEGRGRIVTRRTGGRHACVRVSASRGGVTVETRGTIGRRSGGARIFAPV